MRMRREDLEVVVREALNRLFARDASLIAGDASEWSVAHRLAVYLEELLPGWNIDCEYNRQGVASDSKVVADGSRVRPDIVVHHRGRDEPEHNLLAVELKKVTSGTDQRKVGEYTSPAAGIRTFQYCHGLTIAMVGDWKLTWFENGSEVSQQQDAADGAARRLMLSVGRCEVLVDKRQSSGTPNSE